MSTANKLLYLGETKSILKDTINMSNANITNSTTFRNYAMQLKEGYIDILNNGTDTLYNNFTHLTGKGMTLSFAPTYQAPMKITCYGSTSQASTPTPSNPVDVVNTTGNQSISVYSKNTFDETKLSQEANYNTYNSQTGLWTTNNGGSYHRSILYDAVGSNRDRDITKLIPLKPDTNYTLNLYNFVNNTLETTSNFMSIAFYDNTGTYISQQNKNTSFITFTSPNQECYLDIRRLGSSGTFSFSKVLLVEGTYTSETLPSYEAYNGTNYNIGLGNIELCKIGDYEDKIFKATNEEGLVSGKWYIKKNIGKVVLDGSETYSSMSWGSTRYGYRTSLENLKIITNTSDNSNIISNYYNTYSPNGLYQLEPTNYGISNRVNQSEIIIRNDDCSTSADLKTWLSTHNTTVYYILATPTYTKITDSTLIEQLEAIKSKDNTTNITSSMVIGAIALKKE